MIPLDDAGLEALATTALAASSASTRTCSSRS